MLTRCPESTTVEVEDEDLVLQCVEWSEDPSGAHEGEHHVTLPPALGGVRKWTSANVT